jgi:hypothetical protein
MPVPGKRIILCLDGTWVNSDKGYDRPTLDQPNATLQVPSNVTRVYRSLRNRDRDGTCQIRYYQPGVGSTGGIVDTIAGGLLGAGVSEVGPVNSISMVEHYLTKSRRTCERLTALSLQIMSLEMRSF